MKETEQLKAIQTYAAHVLTNDKTGHNMSHIQRVVNLAQKIQTEEGGDPFIISASAYLHDCLDDKLIANPALAKKELITFLTKMALPEKQRQHILTIIEQISFSYQLDHTPLLTLEAKIVQDADRLDALGAIGIGRTFYYGGSQGNAMYLPHHLPREQLTKEEYRQSSTVIQHFYEKLFKLEASMQTSLGQKIAKERTHFMRQFVETFISEWKE